MPEIEVGRVNDFFAHIGVAGVDLSGALAVGDTIHITGHSTDLQQTVESLQVEHQAVSRAGAGASVGIKVRERCRRGDHVFKVT